MTDNEIIKALECCIIKHNCTDCPQYGNKNCLEIAIKGVLELTARQGAEIERLQAECDNIAEDYSDLMIEKDLLFDEAEALIKKAKVDVVKEFAERLHEKLYTFPVVYNAHFGRMIDNLVKEMELKE